MNKIIAFWVAGTLLASCSISDWDYEDATDDNKSEFANGLDSINGIDVSLYGQARIFPGLVDTAKEERIDTTIFLDLSQPYRQASQLSLRPLRSDKYLNELSIMPQPIFSTGVYAGAGELVTIELPVDGDYGLTAQIGMQTEDLSSSDSYLRQPIVYTRKSLRPGTNKMRFPLGGYIWLIRDVNASGASNVQVRISGGVYNAHDYISGQTNPAQWIAGLRNTTVPWMDIRSKRVIISMSRQRILDMANNNADFATELDRTLDFWNKAVENYYRLLGLQENAADESNLMPHFPLRFIFDVNLVDNKLINVDNEQGLTMMQNSSYQKELLNWKTLKGFDVMDIFDGLMSRYSTFYKPYSSEWNDAAYLLPLYRISEEYYRNGTTSSLDDFGLSFDTLIPMALSYASADSSKWLNADRWKIESSSTTTDYNALRLLILVQLSHYEASVAGSDKAWEFIEERAAQARHNKLWVGSNDLFIEDLSDYFKVNLVSLFDHWGMVIGDAARVYSEKHPPLTKQLWKIDPRKSDPMANVGTVTEKYRHRVNRGEWTALATYDGKYGEANEDDESTNDYYKHPVSKLIDNDKNSYWQSYIKKSVNSYELPYYIIIDMGNARAIDGIYFANGYEKLVSGFTVQTLENTSDLQLADTKDAAWKDWGTVSQTRLTAKRNEQFQQFERRTTRYLRIVLKDDNLTVRPDETTDPTGAENYDKYHSNRRQRLAEFGAWYY